MTKKSNELPTIFETVKRHNIKFVVDSKGNVDGIVKWTGTQWVPGEGRLRRVLAEEGESLASANSMVKSLYGIDVPREVGIDSSSLDSKTELLPTPRFVINIKGETSKHCPEDLNTHCLKLDPDKTVPTPNWNKFLSDLCSENGQRDEGLEQYLTQLLGYSLFGLNYKKEFYFLYGPKGNNGKSTLMGIMSHLLGDYFYTANQDVVIQNKSGQNKFCLAPLNKKRMVCVGEVPAGSKLNTDVLKRITGRDEINAEFKNQNPFTFVPTCKIFCCTNHLPDPSSQGALNSLRQRMRVIPLNNCIPDHLVDRDLDSKLKAEAPGILAKLIRAAIDGYKEEIPVPVRVREEEEQEFCLKDPLEDFLSQYKVDQTSYIRSSEAFDLFNQFQANLGENPIFNKVRSFTKAVRERVPGASSQKKGSHYCLVGIDFNSPINTEPPKAPEVTAEPEMKTATKQEVMAVRTPGESIKKAADRMGVEIAERVISGGESFNEIMEELIKQLAPSQELLESKKYEMFLKVMGRSTNKETIRGSLLTLIDKFENSKS